VKAPTIAAQTPPAAAAPLAIEGRFLVASREKMMSSKKGIISSGTTVNEGQEGAGG